MVLGLVVVVPDENASPTPADTHQKDGKKKGKGGAWEKYKWWFIGGGVILAGIVFYAIRSANSSSNQASSTQPDNGANAGSGAASSIDPLTGDISGTPQDLADLQGLYGSGGSSSSPVPQPEPVTPGNNNPGTAKSGWFNMGGTRYYYNAGAGTIGHNVGKGKKKKWIKTKV